MIERPREWANFARWLLPEMRSEVRLIEWIRDGEIDRVVAFLESWKQSEIDELGEYRAGLGRMVRYFTRRGDFTDVGWDYYYSASEYEQQRLQEISDQIGNREARIGHCASIIRYARGTAEGTLQIEEADTLYAQLSKPISADGAVSHKEIEASRE